MLSIDEDLWDTDFTVYSLLQLSKVFGTDENVSLVDLHSMILQYLNDPFAEFVSSANRLETGCVYDDLTFLL